MKTILIPTDFSDNALHASQYAGMLARRINAKVVLLNIYSVPMVSEYQMAYEPQNYILQSKENAEANLRNFTAKFIENTNLAPDRVTQMVEYGFISDIISETAKSMNADAIVMGTHGASNMIEKWLGTVSEKVMETAECPVWIIPSNSLIRYPETIMYAANFEDDELIATHQVLDITGPLGATCKVIHIHEYFELNVGYGVQEMVNYLADEFKHEKVTFKNLNRSDVVEGLETYIKTHAPDVLAMAIYDKPFFSKIFYTSISKHFVQEAKIPMLTFRKMKV